MRKLLTKVSSKVNRVALGEVTDTKSKESIPLNCLVPFAAASEDFEIILRNNNPMPDENEENEEVLVVSPTIKFKRSEVRQEFIKIINESRIEGRAEQTCRDMSLLTSDDLFRQFTI